MRSHLPTPGENSPTHQTGIHLNPEVTGFAVWFQQLDPIASCDAARIVEASLRSRGLLAEVIQVPAPSSEDIAGRIKDGTALIVMSRSLPPAPLATRIVLVAESIPTTGYPYAIATGDLSSQDQALKALGLLEQSRLLPSSADDAYTPEEEERLAKALDDLGYL